MFWRLVWTSVVPVLKVVILCTVGAVSARKGLLSTEGRRVMSVMAYMVFCPALNFTKLAASLTPDHLLHWWPLLLNMALTIAIGMGLGYITVALVPPEARLRPHTIVCTALGNVGNLPLVIVSSVAQYATGLLHDMPQQKASDLAMSYVMVGVLIAAAVHATIGYNMLKPPADKQHGAAVGSSDAAVLLEDMDSAEKQKVGNSYRGMNADKAAADDKQAEHGHLQNRKPVWLSDDSSSATVFSIQQQQQQHRRTQDDRHAWFSDDSSSATVFAIHQQQASRQHNGRGRDWLSDDDGTYNSTVNGTAGTGSQYNHRGHGWPSDDDDDDDHNRTQLSGHGEQRPRSGDEHIPDSSISHHTITVGTSEAGVGLNESPGTHQHCIGAESVHHQPQSSSTDNTPQHTKQHTADKAGSNHAANLGLSPMCNVLHSRHTDHTDDVHQSSHQNGPPHGPSDTESLLPKHHQSSPAYEPRDTESLLPKHHHSSSVLSIDTTKHNTLAPLRSASSKIPWKVLPTSFSFAIGMNPSSPSAKRLMSHISHMRQRSSGIMQIVLKEAFSPPIISTLISIPVGCIRPLQQAFFAPNAPLRLFTDCLEMLASCTIPCMMIILGATLCNGPGAARVPLKTIVAIGVNRLVVLPFIAVIVIMGSYRLGWFHAPDPVFLLVLLIQNTTPSAINVHTIASVHQNCDMEVSAILFWQYITCIVTMPCFLSMYLYAVQRYFIE